VIRIDETYENSPTKDQGAKGENGNGDCIGAMIFGQQNAGKRGIRREKFRRDPRYLNLEELLFWIMFYIALLFVAFSLFSAVLLSINIPCTYIPRSHCTWQPILWTGTPKDTPRSGNLLSPKSNSRRCRKDKNHPIPPATQRSHSLLFHYV
jgi:hypothetical protein